MNVAWHEMPGTPRYANPSRRERCDWCARLGYRFSQGCVQAIIDAVSGHQTIPYGTVPLIHIFQAWLPSSSPSGASATSSRRNGVIVFSWRDVAPSLDSLRSPPTILGRRYRKFERSSEILARKRADRDTRKSDLLHAPRWRLKQDRFAQTCRRLLLGAQASITQT